MSHLPDTMTALRARARGGPEQLQVESVRRPGPGPGEALVEVHAAAITFGELTWELSWQHQDGTPRTPVIPSHEFSGIVAIEGAVSAPVGTPVMGTVPFDRDGAAAEFVAVPVDRIITKPRSLTHMQAAALPLAAATAWQALVQHAEVGPNERVLVHGGAGGVGAYAVQIATALGADVTATVTAPDLAFARSMGAVRVIDAARERFDSDLQAYDVVIDTVGGEVLQRSFAVLRRGGRLVTLQAPADPDLARAHGVHAMFFVVDADRQTLQSVTGLVDAGQLLVPIAQTFPLQQGRAAYASGSTPGRKPGKTVLIVR